MGIIDNYADLPVGTWQEILLVNKDERRDDIDRQVATVALLSGLSEREVLNLPIAEYKEMAARAAFLNEPCADDGARVAKSYILGGKKYVLQDDFRKITTAQYIDYQTFIQMGDGAVVDILSVFLVPDGMTYGDGYDLDEAKNAIRTDISVKTAVDIGAFFLTQYVAFLTRSLRFSGTMARKAKMKAAEKEIQDLLLTLSGTSGAGSTT